MQTAEATELVNIDCGEIHIECLNLLSTFSELYLVFVNRGPKAAGSAKTE
jgi:hypothetical protein